MLETGCSHRLDGVDGALRPLRCGVIAARLVADVDHDIVFLALDGAADGLPEFHGLRQAGDIADIVGVAVSGGVMVFEDADELVLLALVDDGLHLALAEVVP